MISDPLDLSKIMLKFHGGSYTNLQQFAKDMRDMFDNYKAYFTDTESEVWQIRMVLLHCVTSFKSVECKFVTKLRIL